MTDLVMSEGWCRRAQDLREREGVERHVRLVFEEWKEVPGVQRTPQECRELAEREYGPPYNPYGGKQ